MNATVGSEFRDDGRRLRPGPAGLPPALLRDLNRLDPWRATLSVATTVGTTAALPTGVKSTEC